MKATIYQDDFVEMFSDMGRGHDFSRPARIALFDYYTEMEESCGTEIECDVIAICCDWGEYDTKWLKNDYSYLITDKNKPTLKEILTELENHTTVIKVPLENTYLVAAF